MKRPFVRTTPHIAKPEEYRAVEARWASARFRSRLDYDAERAAAAAAAAKSATRSELRAWLQHPDERVPLALIANESKPWGQKQEGYVLAALNYRVACLNCEGVVWSPVHDALSDRVLYRWVERYCEDERLDPTVLWNPRFFWRIGEAVDVLTRYLEDTDDPAFVDKLLSFRHWQIQVVVANTSLPLTDEELNRVLTEPHLSQLRAHYAGSPSLEKHHLATIERWIAEGVQHAIEAGDVELVHERTALIWRLESKDLSTETIDTLIQLAVSAETLIRRFVTRRLIGHPGLRPSHVERLYDLEGNAPVMAGYVARHPAASTELLRRIAREHSLPRVRQALAKRIRDTGDDELTALLAKSDDKVVWSRILAYGLGPGFAAVLAEVQKLEKETRSGTIMGAIYSLMRRLETEIGKPNAQVMAEVDRGESTNINEIVAALVHDKFGRPQSGKSWTKDLLRERPLVALFLLRRLALAVVSPEETAFLAASDDKALRLSVITSLSDTKIGRRTSEAEKRRVRRKARRACTSAGLLLESYGPFRRRCALSGSPRPPPAPRPDR